MRAYVAALTAELQRHGVEEWTLETDHRHPRLRFEHEGRPLRVVFPGTTSDSRRGVKNAVSGLRRIIREGGTSG